MAAALFNGASTTKADKVKLFMKDLKAAVRKENESSTKIRSFNKLLRRVPGRKVSTVLPRLELMIAGCILTYFVI